MAGNMSIKKIFSRVFIFIALILFILWLSLFWRIFLFSFIDETRQAKAIIVLADNKNDGNLSSVFRARLDHAVELYQQENAPLIFVMSMTGKEGVENNSG